VSASLTVSNNVTVIGTITGDGSGLTGTGTAFTAGNSLALGGVALAGLVPTNTLIVAGANITVNGGSFSPLTGNVTIASTASGGGGGGLTNVVVGHARFAIPSGSVATRGGTDYELTVMPSNAFVRATALPIFDGFATNGGIAFAFWTGSPVGTSTSLYLVAACPSLGVTNPVYTVTNYVSVIGGSVNYSNVTGITAGRWDMEIRNVGSATNWFFDWERRAR
jgi:hypothetical protein